MNKENMTHGGDYRFLPQFEPSKINELAQRYDSKEDEEPLQAGCAIRDGDHSRANLMKIFEWKTRGRGRTRLSRNTDIEIADALRIAVEAKTDRASVAVLCGLSGVAVPVASAIMTAIDPSRYTIIDFRALEALGYTGSDRTIDFYLGYLSKCRDLAKEYKVSLRDFDRALWQWSKDRSTEKEQPRISGLPTEAQHG
jgi:hypothetical protein